MTVSHVGEMMWTHRFFLVVQHPFLKSTSNDHVDPHVFSEVVQPFQAMAFWRMEVMLRLLSFL